MEKKTKNPNDLPKRKIKEIKPVKDPIPNAPDEEPLKKPDEIPVKLPPTEIPIPSGSTFTKYQFQLL